MYVIWDHTCMHVWTYRCVCIYIIKIHSQTPVSVMLPFHQQNGCRADTVSDKWQWWEWDSDRYRGRGHEREGTQDARHTQLPTVSPHLSSQKLPKGKTSSPRTIIEVIVTSSTDLDLMSARVFLSGLFQDSVILSQIQPWQRQQLLTEKGHSPHCQPDRHLGERSH